MLIYILLLALQINAVGLSESFQGYYYSAGNTEIVQLTTESNSFENVENTVSTFFHPTEVVWEKDPGVYYYTHVGQIIISYDPDKRKLFITKPLNFYSDDTD